MDDLKIITCKDKGMPLKISQEAYDDIAMKLGYYKCARISIKGRKIESTQNTIKRFEANQSLGVWRTIDCNKMKS